MEMGQEAPPSTPRTAITGRSLQQIRRASRSSLHAQDVPHVPAQHLKLHGHWLQRAEPKLRGPRCCKPTRAPLPAGDKTSMVCFSIQKLITTSPSLLHSSFVLTYALVIPRRNTAVRLCQPEEEPLCPDSHTQCGGDIAAKAALLQHTLDPVISPG